MKRPLQLPLAIALALGATNAFALGLGTIHVNSKLNQPLDAEIPVLQGTQGEAEGLLVQLAAAEDFDRVGLNRSRLSVPLEFTLVKNPHGEMVIKVTSKEVVREPFLDFLVEANWPKGRLLREYTVLLDPPVMAPATGTTQVAQAPKATERPAAPPPAEKPKAAAPPPKSAPVAAAPRPEKPAPAPKAAPAAPAPKAAGSNEYTVQEGDTLSGIAREVKADDATNINQLMLALLKQNPNAFYKDNINALKRGAILRIPNADQLKAVGSASEAAAMVHSQIEDWRGGAAAKPTLVADTGAAPEPKAKPSATKAGSTGSSASTTTRSGSERLELVPPKAGKDSVAMNDRPGSGANGSSAQSTELKSELARTKEALTAREQETGELKSRVKELEDTKSKSDRLITLKDSEIADLQKKLKDLQDTSKTGAKATASTTPAATTTTPPAATPPATSAPPSTAKVSKEDIWGNAATSPENKTPAATAATTGTGSTASSTTPSTTPPATTTPASGSSTTPSTSATTTAGGTTTPSTTTPSTSGSTTPSTTASTTPSTTPSTTSSTTPSTSTTTPSGTTGSSTSTPPASTAATTPAKPAATTAPVKTAKTTTQPLPSNTPAWYDQAWVKPAAIGAAALLLLAGLLSMRRRKAAAAAAERGSIAGAFGDSPLRDDGGDGTVAIGGEEQALREQIEHDPANLGLHLELLSLFYAERDVGAFEDAAEAMHQHVTDPHQPEWLEAQAMGQELAPHNTLFSDGAGVLSAFDDEAVTARHAAATPFDHDDVFAPHHEPAAHDDEPLMPLHETPPPAAHANTAFDFDLDAEPAPKTTSAAATEPPFAFDNLPPIDFSKEAEHEFEAAAPAPLHVDEDEFAGEDGVGTKLDLAKAYLDMGDPEGARSMLEEVLSEGNDSQKGEARRLMAEIR